MNEPDTARILDRDSFTSTENGSPTDECGPPEKPTTRSGRPPLDVPGCPVTVEPVMFLSMFSLVLQGPLSTQYLFDRISEDVGFNRSKTSECGNGSLPPDPLQKVAIFTRLFKY